MNKIVIDSPLDMHTHLRQGALMQSIIPLTCPTWAGVLGMPNTDPPLTTAAQLRDYLDDIMLTTGNADFKPYLTLYFQTTYTREFLESVEDLILSVKFYPKNLTTGSQHGCDPGDPKVLDILGYCEELGIPVNVHPEAEGYYHDREQLFMKYAYDWTNRFPNLKLILEHLSDAESLHLLERPNVYGTVTPQHLLTTGNDWFGPPFDYRLYCMPCVKRPEDRDGLMQAVTGGSYEKFHKKLMAGTDSAGHDPNKKVQCGCAGVFSAPIALQLYAQAFDRAGKLDKLQGFVSDNARQIYGLTPPEKKVSLVRQPFTIPQSYLGVHEPMWAGRTIDWSIE